MSDERDELRRKKLTLPSGLQAAKEFLQTYVYDADLDQIEGGIRHMMRTNPITVITGMDGLEEVLSTEQPPETLAQLVEFDANKSLDVYGDAEARAWLERLVARVREWMKSEPVQGEP